MMTHALHFAHFNLQVDFLPDALGDAKEAAQLRARWPGRLGMCRMPGPTDEDLDEDVAALEAAGLRLFVARLAAVVVAASDVCSTRGRAPVRARGYAG